MAGNCETLAGNRPGRTRVQPDRLRRRALHRDSGTVGQDHRRSLRNRCGDGARAMGASRWLGGRGLHPFGSGGEGDVGGSRAARPSTPLFSRPTKFPRSRSAVLHLSRSNGASASSTNRTDRVCWTERAAAKPPSRSVMYANSAVSARATSSANPIGIKAIPLWWDGMRRPPNNPDGLSSTDCPAPCPPRWSRGSPGDGEDRRRLRSCRLS